MIEYILWWLLAVLWFGCGILGRGINIGYWSNKYPDVNVNQHRQAFSLDNIIMGPYYLLIVLLYTRFKYFGITF